MSQNLLSAAVILGALWLNWNYVWSTIAYYFVTLIVITFMQTVQNLMRRRFRPELFANVPVMDLSA